MINRKENPEARAALGASQTDPAWRLIGSEDSKSRVLHQESPRISGYVVGRNLVVQEVRYA